MTTSFGGDDVLDPVERMPRPELTALQDHRLHRMLAHVHRSSPLVRELWDRAGVSPSDIRTREDFFALAPFMDKDTIRGFRDAHRDPCGGFLRPDAPGLTGVYTTSGTTGDPTPLPHGHRLPHQIAYARSYWHIGVRPGDHAVNMSFTFRSGSSYQALRDIGAVAIPLSHEPGVLPRLVEALKRYQPSMLVLLSNPMLIGLERLFETTGEDPSRLFASLKGGIYGGEPLGPRYRAMMKEWGIEVFEIGPLGDVCSSIDCRAHAGLHANEDLALVECLAPGGTAPVPDGEVGEMVVTTLFDPFVPLIRYRTDDLCVMDTAPCACGGTHLRYRILGRKGDQTIVAGRSILPLEIRALLENFRPTRGALFQIIRPKPELEVLALRVGYAADLLEGTLDGFARRLATEIEQALGVPVRIDMVPESELLKLGPPHKIPRVAKA